MIYFLYMRIKKWTGIILNKLLQMKFDISRFHLSFAAKPPKKPGSLLSDNVVIDIY